MQMNKFKLGMKLYFGWCVCDGHRMLWQENVLNIILNSNILLVFFQIFLTVKKNHFLSHLQLILLSIRPRLTLLFWPFSILQCRIWYFDSFHHPVTFAFLVFSRNFHQYVSNQLHKGSTHRTINYICIFYRSESNQINPRFYQIISKYIEKTEDSKSRTSFVLVIRESLTFISKYFIFVIIGIKHFARF